MPSRSIPITSASFAWSSKPSTEYASTARDHMRIDSGVAYVFLRAVVDIPEGERLVSAQLRVATEDSYTGSRVFTAQRANAPASYKGLNWNNRPNVATSTVARNFTQNTSARLVTWDVTADVTGRRVIDWRIISDDTTARHFEGTRAPSGSPRLVIVTEAASLEPDGLTPDGGAVSVASPVLQWNPHEDALGFRVQIDEADGDFSTPLYDSGEVTSGRASHTPVYSLTAGGTDYDWRVAHKFPSGLGDYSDPATIERIVKPAVTITNPLATTADPTPPVVWSSAGQEAWRVIVTRNGSEVANSGKRSGADTSWAPPKGAKSAGDILVYTVRTYDAVDRVASSGDPTYAEATLTSTYAPTDTVAPMTAVSVTQDGDTPAVLIDYDRATGVPDEVIIGIDGEPLHRQAGVDGAWECWTAAPNTDAEAYVTAVVDEEASDVDRIASFRTKVTGVWLVDPATGRWFSISGDQLTMAYGGVSQTHTPVSAAALITRTSALRGVEGEVSGEIVAVADKTVAEQVADLWWMRSRPHRVYRLIMGDLNIPVTTSNLWAAFDPATSATHRIDTDGRFSFAQTRDELPFEPI